MLYSTVGDFEPGDFEPMDTLRQFSFSGMRKEDIHTIEEEERSITGFNKEGQIVYRENRWGEWFRNEYAQFGKYTKRVYYEDSDGYWTKAEYNKDGKLIFREQDNGDWYKQEFDKDGQHIYSEWNDGNWAKVRLKKGNRI